MVALAPEVEHGIELISIGRFKTNGVQLLSASRYQMSFGPNVLPRS